ncbi:DUF2281 domain-containing protein [Chitinimonas koreensis]|uniref:DUF2281 domain-containing protein n=1 Tax=Chitinimonas koreensis TaxID=356302 RepID=UPI0003F85C63|nr:DUF2281 domain-containing protein [Chitinimonas koreensis]QNM98736.1 DUF2281 domain-containing protein [Chitinimonas koreensis]
MTIAERIFREVSVLPDPLAAEVLDFVEFLKARQARPANEGDRDDSLQRFVGSLKGTKAFPADLASWQREVRDEWR